MKLKIFLIFVGVIAGSSTYAADKNFKCEVKSFNYARTGINAWKDQAETVYTASIKQWYGDRAEIHETMKVVGPYEIVFEAEWESSTLQNDDITIKPDPKISVHARLQERIADGKIRVLDIEHDISRPGPQSGVIKRMYSTVRLTNLAALSDLMKDPNVSNFNISQNFKDVDVEGLFNFSCSTEI